MASVAIEPFEEDTAGGEENGDRSRRFDDTPSLKKHGYWVVIGRLLNVLMTALSAVVAARLLSQAEFGRFVATYAATYLLSLIGVYGLSHGVLLDVGRLSARPEPGAVRQLLKSYALLTCLTVTLAGLASIGFFLACGERLVEQSMSLQAVLACSLLAVLRGLIQVCGEACRALDEPFGANMLGGQSCGPIASIVFLILLAVSAWLMTPGWETAVWAYCGATAFTTSLLFVRLARLYRNLPKSSERGTGIAPPLGDLAVALWPLFGVLVVSSVLQSDVFLVGVSDLPAEDIGLYEAGRRLVMLLQVPLAFVNLMVVSSIARLLAQGNRMVLERQLRGLAALASVPCFLGAALLFVMPETILIHVYGEGFREGAVVLQLMIPGFLLMTLTGSCGIVLIHSGKSRAFLIAQTCAMLILVTAALPTLHAYGISGMAVLVSVVFGGCNVVVWWLAYRLTGIWTHPDYRHVLSFRIPGEQ